MVARRVWRRQALHAHLPACVPSACVPGSRRADRTLQEPQQAAVKPPTAGLSYPNRFPREHLRGLAPSRGLWRSLGD